MQRKNINILGLSETHWKKSGHFTSDSGNKIYFSGPADESSKGVAFIVPPQLDKFVLEYRPVSDRVITIKLNATPCKLNIIQVYAPTATNSTEEEIEEFYGVISQTMKQIPKREITVVIGDLNAKIGSTRDDANLRHVVGNFGVGSRNDRGDRLLQFCSEEHLTVMNTCFKNHIRRLYTWISPGDRFRNQIDYIMIQTRWRSSVLNAVTYPGADCGSDHQLLMATLKIKLKRLHKPRQPKSLTKVDIKGFRCDFERNLPSVSKHDANSLGITWDTFKDIITQTASQNALPRTPMKDFITPETAKIILERRKLKERGFSTPEDLERYGRLNKEVQRLCRRDKNDEINRICADLEKHATRNETKDLYRKLKELTKTQSPKTRVLEDEAGNLLYESQDIQDRWKRYCAELYGTGDIVQPELQWDQGENEPDILMSEVEQAIKALKTDKAPGKDGIPAELLKNVGNRGIALLTEICNTVWETGHWPDDWTESVFVPLHKRGSTNKCSNYRTIALISHASKILLHIINKRLKHYLDRQIPEEQAGFVKGRGTREQILNIRQIIEKSREFNIPVILCFIDYTKAFDCVEWTKLWDVLMEMGVPKHLVGLIRTLYVANRSFVRTETGCSDMFETRKGVRQGCTLSPVLFNIYGEYIIRKALENWKGGFVIGGKRIANLRYADDTTLLATSMDEMQTLLQKIESESTAMGLAINRSKTKLMVVDRAGVLPNTNAIPNLEVTEQFNYLGSLICNDGGCVPEIKRRIAIAKDAMTRLGNIWRNRGITNTTKTRLVRSLIFPIFLYGVETWTILARERLRIDAFEMWCWRRMLRIPWTAKRTNVSILSQLKITDRLSTLCLRRIMSYFGHIARRGENNLEKLIVVGNVEGKRARGRSPTRWSDQLRESPAQRFYTTVHMAADRNRWRQFVRSRVMT